MKHSELLKSLRRSSDYSDLTIKCGDRTFPVHKNIVCSISEYFKKACEKNKWQEGQECLIHLKAIESDSEHEDFSCDHPGAVKLMLDYLYLGDYTVDIEADPPEGHKIIDYADAEHDASSPGVPPACDPFTDNHDPWNSFCSKKRSKKAKKTSDVWDISEICALPSLPVVTTKQPTKPRTGMSSNVLSMHARLYGMGAKYDISSLKDAAIKKFKKAVQGTWDRKDLAAAILITFGSTPDTECGLRDVVIKTILDCSAALATDPFIEKSISAIDGLSFALFKQQSLKR